jgi:glycosyltransferase involved in cell wall biosynthesis
MIINLIIMFERQGFNVTVFSNNETELKFNENNFNIKFIGRNYVNVNYSFLWKLYYYCLNKINWFISFFKSWESENSELYKFSIEISKIFSEELFDEIYAIECFSLIACYDSYKYVDIDSKLLYVDMELLDWSANNNLYFKKSKLKILQFEALKKVSHVFITSYNRANIFSKINNFQSSEISVLPVVPLKKIVTPSSYFIDKFAISEDKHIILYSGNFMPWAQCLEIIKSFDSTWPPNCVLIMHTWNSDSLLGNYFSEMKECAKGKQVFFSSGYLNSGEYSNAIAAAKIGLLFYQNIDSNFNEILLSSNKMSDYVSVGLPIICSPFPSLVDFVNDNSIGFAVDFNEIGNSISKIISNYDDYRSAVLKCSSDYFQFEKYYFEAFKN